jgi:hypothetical protein
MSIKEFVDGISTTLTLLISSPVSALLSLVGLALLLLAGGLAYVAAKSKPDELTSSIKAALFLSLVGGMVFSGAGPSVALLRAVSTPKMPTEQAMKNLETNAEVKHAIRLISYNPGVEPGRALDRLTNLGPPEQLYSFVASYDELVGHKVLDALAKAGDTTKDVRRVSAIIFPLNTPIFPANARGLLQVVQEI